MRIGAGLWRRLGSSPLRGLGQVTPKNRGRARYGTYKRDCAIGRDTNDGKCINRDHNPSMILGKSRSDNNTTKGIIIQR